MALLADPPRDRRLFLSLGALHFLVIVAFTWARIVRDGTLLSRLDVAWVPWLTVAVLVATAVLTPVVARLARGNDPLRAFARVALVTGASLVAADLVLRYDGPWSAAVLYVWVGAYGPLLVAQFWLLVHGRLDADQARRLIGGIGALGIVGGAVAGLAVSAWVDTMSLGRWLGLTALVHGLAGVGALALRAPAGAAPADTQAPAGVVRARQLLGECGYARLLAAVVVIGAAVGAVIDYQFKLALQRQSTDAAALGQWLGLFNIGVNVVALAAQLLTSVLLTRFGSRWLALVLPAGVVAGAASGLAVPTVWPPVLTRLWENAARHSIARTANEFFFFPFQAERRVAMKHAAEGFLTRAGEVAASGLLVVLTTTRLDQPWSLSLLTVGLGGAWLVLIAWLGRAYGPALSASLDRLLRPGQVAAPGEGERRLPAEELVALLHSRDPRHIGFALDELAATDVQRARLEARRLTRHSSSDVQARARRLLAPAAAPLPPVDAPAAADALRAVLRSGDLARVEQSCERIVAAADRTAVPTLLEALSGHPRLRVRETLVRLDDAIVGALGDTLVDARQPMRTRRDVAVVLGRIGTPAALGQLQRVTRAAPPALRSLALRGLNAARKRGITLLLDGDAVRADIDADLDELAARQQQRAAFADDPLVDPGLLPAALEEAIAHLREHAFRRLALLYPTRETLRAHRGVASADARIRAFALEYLDATLSPEDRDRVLPRLRAVPAVLPVVVDDLLASLAADADPWIATLAVHAIGRRRARGLRHVVAAANAGDTIREETVRWALARL